VLLHGLSMESCLRMKNREIPFVSDELMEQIDRIFYHGEQRAKSHDLRFGQYLVNSIYKKYGNEIDDVNVSGILFNMENPELLELIKKYND